MIKLEHLSKIYKCQNEQDVIALDDINLTFPNQGLVFIVGKSGSGKSTLLNMIGTLDDVSFGHIIVDGNDLTLANESLLNDYRNSYLGFVFQDYYLIEQLSVKENIKLALAINEQDDDSKVDEIIEKVGLTEQASRLPKSLSGGQKQRVAIARSVIKNPKVLLCDEPTGNLDSKTGQQIMSLLKKISKDVLVIVVSHNLDDAYQYGDRLIEISDGKIINDLKNTGNENKYDVIDKTLYINNINDLSSDNLNKINEELKSGKITSLASKNKLFIKQDEILKDEKPSEIIHKKISFKDKLKLGFKLNKKRTLSTIFVSIGAALLTVLLGLSQSFVSFSSDKIFNDVLTNNNQKTLAFRKGEIIDKRKGDVDLSYLLPLTSQDDELITNSGYQGNHYRLYNYSLPISLKSWQLTTENAVIDAINLKDLYLQEIYGVLPCSDDFLSKLFGDNYTYTGKLNDKDYGIIITDYIADSILYYRNDLFKNYDDILGTYRNNAESTYAYINAIVNTGYKEKHQALFKMYQPNLSINELEDILLSNEYLSFYEDVKNYLGIAYSINPDFINASRVKEARNIVRFDNSIINFKAFNEKSGISAGWAYGDNVIKDLSLTGKTIAMSKQEINRIFNKSLSEKDFNKLDGSEIELERFHIHQKDKTPMATIKATLKVYETQTFSCVVSDELFSELRLYDVMAYMYYFDNFEGLSNLYQDLKAEGFVPYSSYVEAGNAINKVVIVFKDFFILILVLLITILLFTLTYNAYLSVKSSKYNIGILKALGMPDKDISFVFILHSVMIGLITSILFIVGLFGFAAMTNDILFNSFMEYLANPALRFIKILTLNPWIFILDIAIIFIVTFITMMIPMLLMKKIKPLNIIKKGE